MFRFDLSLFTLWVNDLNSIDTSLQKFGKSITMGYIRYCHGMLFSYSFYLAYHHFGRLKVIFNQRSCKSITHLKTCSNKQVWREGLV